MRKAEVTLYLTVVFILANLWMVEAKTLYVSGRSGSVSSDCREVAPCPIKEGIKIAKKGDIVQFEPGDCRCPFDTLRNGVTFRGASGLLTRLLDDGNSRNGKQIVRITHNDIILEGFVIDGERRMNSGHGLVRMGNTARTVIRGNRIINSGSAHISVGGSIKNSVIDTVEISNNTLCGSGYVGEFGEAIYVADHKGTSKVKNIRIFGNEICEFSDNGVDLKPGATGVRIFENWFHDQVERSGRQGNQGTIVTQDTGNRIYDNIFENVIGGSSVFNLASHADTQVTGNVIIGVKKTKTLVRKRTGLNSSSTVVRDNQFCGTNTKSAAFEPGLIVQGNTGIDLPTIDCAPRRAKIMTLYQAHRMGDVVAPIPLADLKVTDIFLTRFGDNDIRLVFETVDGSPVRVKERAYLEGSVRFFNLEGKILEIRRNKPAKLRLGNLGPGWIWYLKTHVPEGVNIRMQADKGWVTGAPEINQQLENFHPIPIQPVIEMTQGQSGSCKGEVMVSPRADGNGQKIACTGETRGALTFEFEPKDIAFCPGNVVVTGNPWDPFVVIECQ